MNEKSSSQPFEPYSSFCYICGGNSWKKFFLCLTLSDLLIYETSNQTEIKKHIFTENIIFVNQTRFHSSDIRQFEKYGFTIFLNHKHESIECNYINICSLNEKQQKIWIEKIQHVVEMYQKIKDQQEKIGKKIDYFSKMFIKSTKHQESNLNEKKKKKKKISPFSSKNRLSLPFFKRKKMKEKSEKIWVDQKEDKKNIKKKSENGVKRRSLFTISFGSKRNEEDDENDGIDDDDIDHVKRMMKEEEKMKRRKKRRKIEKVHEFKIEKSFQFDDCNDNNNDNRRANILLLYDYQFFGSSERNEYDVLSKNIDLVESDVHLYDELFLNERNFLDCLQHVKKNFEEGGEKKSRQKLKNVDFDNEKVVFSNFSCRIISSSHSRNVNYNKRLDRIIVLTNKLKLIEFNTGLLKNEVGKMFFNNIEQLEYILVSNDHDQNTIVSLLYPNQLYDLVYEFKTIEIKRKFLLIFQKYYFQLNEDKDGDSEKLKFLKVKNVFVYSRLNKFQKRSKFTSTLGKSQDSKKRQVMNNVKFTNSLMDYKDVSNKHYSLFSKYQGDKEILFSKGMIKMGYSLKKQSEIVIILTNIALYVTKYSRSSKLIVKRRILCSLIEYVYQATFSENNDINSESTVVIDKVLLFKITNEKDLLIKINNDNSEFVNVLLKSYKNIKSRELDLEEFKGKIEKKMKKKKNIDYKGELENALKTFNEVEIKRLLESGKFKEDDELFIKSTEIIKELESETELKNRWNRLFYQENDLKLLKFVLKEFNSFRYIQTFHSWKNKQGRMLNKIRNIEMFIYYIHKSVQYDDVKLMKKMVLKGKNIKELEIIIKKFKYLYDKIKNRKYFMENVLNIEKEKDLDWLRLMKLNKKLLPKDDFTVEKRIDKCISVLKRGYDERRVIMNDIITARLSHDIKVLEKYMKNKDISQYYPQIQKEIMFIQNLELQRKLIAKYLKDKEKDKIKQWLIENEPRSFLYERELLMCERVMKVIEKEDRIKELKDRINQLTRKTNKKVDKEELLKVIKQCKLMQDDKLQNSILKCEVFLKNLLNKEEETKKRMLELGEIERKKKEEEFQSKNLIHSVFNSTMNTSYNGVELYDLVNSIKKAILNCKLDDLCQMIAEMRKKDSKEEYKDFLIESENFLKYQRNQNKLKMKLDEIIVSMDIEKITNFLSINRENLSNEMKRKGNSIIELLENEEKEMQSLKVRLNTILTVKKKDVGNESKDVNVIKDLVTKAKKKFGNAMDKELSSLLVNAEDEVKEVEKYAHFENNVVKELHILVNKMLEHYKLISSETSIQTEDSKDSQIDEKKKVIIISRENDLYIQSIINIILRIFNTRFRKKVSLLKIRMEENSMFRIFRNINTPNCIRMVNMFETVEVYTNELNEGLKSLYFVEFLFDQNMFVNCIDEYFQINLSNFYESKTVLLNKTNLEHLLATFKLLFNEKFKFELLKKRIEDRKSYLISIMSHHDSSNSLHQLKSIIQRIVRFFYIKSRINLPFVLKHNDYELNLLIINLSKYLLSIISMLFVNLEEDFDIWNILKQICETYRNAIFNLHTVHFVSSIIDVGELYSSSTNNDSKNINNSGIKKWESFVKYSLNTQKLSNNILFILKFLTKQTPDKSFILNKSSINNIYLLVKKLDNLKFELDIL